MQSPEKSSDSSPSTDAAWLTLSVSSRPLCNCANQPTTVDTGTVRGGAEPHGWHLATTTTTVAWQGAIASASDRVAGGKARPHTVLFTSLPISVPPTGEKQSLLVLLIGNDALPLSCSLPYCTTHHHS
jgi:hypothetical protein